MAKETSECAKKEEINNYSSHKRESRRITTRRARRKLRAALNYVSAEDYICKQKIESHNKKLLTDYGFVANPNISVKANASIIISKNPQWFEMDLPTNLTYHNLCTYLQPPCGLSIILGLGEKFCIEKLYPEPPIKDTIH